MAKYFLGLDLGQTRDYTALAVVQRHADLPKARYDLRHVERFPLGTSYPDIVERVAGVLDRAPLSGSSSLAVDATGVGAPVVDLLRALRMRASMAAITITGGDSVTREEGNAFKVPKRDLVSTLQVLLQCGRLKIAQSLPLADIVVKELLNFHVTINVKTAHDSYSAWREGTHDDLVLAVAMACWLGEQQPCVVGVPVGVGFRCSPWAM